jgi:hypothetical protein
MIYRCYNNCDLHDTTLFIVEFWYIKKRWATNTVSIEYVLRSSLNFMQICVGFAILLVFFRFLGPVLCRKENQCRFDETKKRTEEDATFCFIKYRLFLFGLTKSAQTLPILLI